MRLGQVAHADAWTMASINTARLMGFDEKLGIAQGAEATLAVSQLGSDGVSIDVQQTWVAGRLVFDQTRDARVSMPDAPPDAAHPI